MNFITKYFKKHKITTVLDPIVIEYTNPTDKKLTAIIFGFNDFFAFNNFGNGELIVKNLQTNDNGYNRLMCQSGFKPFVFRKARIQSSSMRMLHKTLFINHKGANGNEKRKSINLSAFRDAYQFQNDIIDINCGDTKIDGNTFLELEIDPNTSFCIYIFPEESKLVSYKKYKNHLLLLNKDKRVFINIQPNETTFFANFTKKIELFFTNLKLKFNKTKIKKD